MDVLTMLTILGYNHVISTKRVGPSSPWQHTINGRSEHTITEDGEKNKLVIGSGYPFPCVTKLDMSSYTANTFDVIFAPGAMQRLQSLMFKFSVKKELDQFGRFDFGLENLSSLEDIAIEMCCYHVSPEDVKAAEDAIQSSLDMNPNKPRLELDKVTGTYVQEPETYGFNLFILFSHMPLLLWRMHN
jgi:hypothetical protein